MERPAKFWANTILALNLLGLSCATQPVRSPTNPTPSPLEQRALEIDLGLNINEEGFWKAVNAGPIFGLITETSDKARMDCLGSLGDFCIAEASPNFKVAINQPIADFMFRQSGLFNPSLPTRMLLVEEWLDTSEEQTGAFTAVANDRSDQVIVISLKTAVLQALKDLERKGLSPEVYFDGAVSYFVSQMSSHEMADAGARTKKLLAPGAILIGDNLIHATQSQVFAFSNRYTELYDQASAKEAGRAALIFGVTLETGVELESYRASILQEAAHFGWS